MSHAIEKRSGPVRAVWNGQELASSDHTLFVEGNHYFPPESVHRANLEPSSQRSHCPWKGDASYLDAVAGDERNEGAAWFYPEPLPEAEEVRDHVAFWKGVEIAEG